MAAHLPTAPANLTNALESSFEFWVDKDVERFVTPCESTRESCYINVHGRFYPCSFNEEGAGIDVASCGDFLGDVWNARETEEWRQRLLANGCSCPTYEV